MQPSLGKHLLTLLPYWHYEIEKPLKQVLKNNGLSLEVYYGLQYLKREGSKTMGEFSLRLNISKQQATKMINYLFEKNYIERIFDSQDRRIIQIRITQEAIDFLEHVNIESQLYELLKQTFTKEEIASLDEIIISLLQLILER